MADVCAITLDEVLCELIETIEVIAGVGLTHRCKAEPCHNLPNGIVVPLLLAFWVGVIEAQNALATVVLCKSKVYRDGLAVTDVEVSVGLGWESRADLGHGL